MPFPLHKAPVGLLELYRLRTQGAAPPMFGDQVTPTADTRGMYGADLQTVDTQNATGAINAGGLAVGRVFQFPGRLLVTSGAIIVGAAAGTQIQIFLQYRPQASLTFVTLGMTIIDAPRIGALYAAIPNFAEPLVFPSGSEFRIFVQGDAGGADHFVQRDTLFENFFPG